MGDFLIPLFFLYLLVGINIVRQSFSISSVYLILYLFVFVVLQSCSVLSNSFATPWTITYQARLSMGFPRQAYWNGQSFPSPRDLPDPGIKPTSPALQADSLLLSHQESPSVSIVIYISLTLFFWSHDTAYRTLVSQPGIELRPWQ